jgi:hypothetical protein
MIVNYDSSVVNKFGASLTDNAIVIIYNRNNVTRETLVTLNRNMFIVQPTGYFIIAQYLVFVFMANYHSGVCHLLNCRCTRNKDALE